MKTIPHVALPVVTLALAPLLYLQGRRVRRIALRLPEASGPRTGVVGDGEPMRLLIVGDSSAAGVGAATQDEALAGRLADELGRDHRLEWRLLARTGATTAATLARLRHEPPEPPGPPGPPGHFDVAVVCLGVNDVTSGVSLRRWRDDQLALHALLAERFGAGLVVVNGLPPMGAFPLLPQPLRWYLGGNARRLTEVLVAELRGRTDRAFVALDFTDDPRLMAADGFHPGPRVYAEWARRVAEAIRRAEQGRDRDTARVGKPSVEHENSPL